MWEVFDDADIASLLAERSALIDIVSQMIDWEPDEDDIESRAIWNKARSLLAKIKEFGNGT